MDGPTSLMDETPAHPKQALLALLSCVAALGAVLVNERVDGLGEALTGVLVVVAIVLARALATGDDRRFTHLSPEAIPLGLAVMWIDLGPLVGAVAAASVLTPGFASSDVAAGGRVLLGAVVEAVTVWTIWTLAPTTSLAATFLALGFATAGARTARTLVETSGDFRARVHEALTPRHRAVRAAFVVQAAAVAALSEVSPLAMALALTPLPVVWALGSAEARLDDSHRRLRRIHAAVEALSGLDDAESIAEATAERLAEATAAPSVFVRLWDVDGAPTDALVGAPPPLQPPASPTDGPTWVQALASSEVVAVGGSDDRRHDRLDGATGVLIRPLRDERGCLGVVIVGRTVESDERNDIWWTDAIGVHATIAARKSTLHSAVKHAATHDRLTGLANRSHFDAWLRSYLEAGHPGSALLVDLDRFKEVNDTFGHEAGDRLLVEAASRLVGGVRVGDLVARFGGDEFAIFMPGLDATDALERADRLAAQLEEPFDIGPTEIAIGASIGVATAPDHSGDGPTLLRAADLAMYHAKRQRLRAAAYGSSLEARDARRLTLLTDLRSAVRRGELTVHYQPQVELGGGRVIGLEALVRWRHPLGEWIQPDVFVELAEQAGLIDELTEHVLTTASRDTAALLADGYDLRLSVNLSAQSLLDARLEHLVLRSLESGGLAADRLTLEITETTMMSDGDRTAHLLNRLAHWGIEISVDDFGTGFSSLVSLRQMPIAEVKIDRSFVMRMTEEHNDQVIVRSTIELAHNLGLVAIAEGVEDLDTVRMLSELGCDVAQGYGIGRPVPLEDLRPWLARWTTTDAGLRAGPVPERREAARPVRRLHDRVAV